MASGDTKTESYLRTAAEGTRADLPSDNCCNTKTQNLIVGVANRIMDVEDEVEELKNNPDVVDIVDTYQDLQNYDTSTLTDKDIIRVLQDSTHSGNSTYYRWNATTNQFDFVGEVASSGDTVYSDKTTSNSNTGGAVYIGNLNSNQEEQPDPTVTDYHFKYFWALPYSNTNTPNDRTVNILGTNAGGNWAVAIGDQSNVQAGNDYGIAIGYSARIEANGGIAIGGGASVASGLRNSIALGARSNPTRSGEVNIGNTWGAGYNNTDYRVIGGVHDGIDAHDAVTVGQLNTRMGGMTILSITQAAYDALATKDPNTLYVITGA